MIQISVNYAAVIVAAIVNMVVGSLWFGPIFGKIWISMAGITSQQMDEAKKKGMGKTYVIAFLSSLVLAYILAELTVLINSYVVLSEVAVGLKAGFMGWIGFVVPVLLATVLWEGKSWKLWFLNAAYYLVSLLLMGTILSLWM